MEVPREAVTDESVILGGKLHGLAIIESDDNVEILITIGIDDRGRVDREGLCFGEFDGFDKAWSICRAIFSTDESRDRQCCEDDRNRQEAETMP